MKTKNFILIVFLSASRSVSTRNLWYRWSTSATSTRKCPDHESLHAFSTLCANCCRRLAGFMADPVIAVIAMAKLDAQNPWFGLYLGSRQGKHVLLPCGTHFFSRLDTRDALLRVLAVGMQVGGAMCNTRCDDASSTFTFTTKGHQHKAQQR
jgi:hypothetical protein